VTEQFIFVRFVWTKRDVDRRVEIHPGDVACVIIVGAERVGAFVEKVAEGSVGCERGSFAEQLRRWFEDVFVSLTVRNDRQLFIRAAANQMKEPCRLLLLSFRKRLQPRVELFLRHVLGIVVRPKRLFAWDAVDERLFLVESRPWTIVDQKIVQALA